MGRPGTFKKGQGGRKKGSLNKSTRDANEALARIMQMMTTGATLDEIFASVRRTKPETLIGLIGRTATKDLSNKDGSLNKAVIIEMPKMDEKT